MYTPNLEAVRSWSWKIFTNFENAIKQYFFGSLILCCLGCFIIYVSILPGLFMILKISKGHFKIVFALFASSYFRSYINHIHFPDSFFGFERLL